MAGNVEAIAPGTPGGIGDIGLTLIAGIRQGVRLRLRAFAIGDAGQTAIALVGVTGNYAIALAYRCNPEAGRIDIAVLGTEQVAIVGRAVVCVPEVVAIVLRRQIRYHGGQTALGVVLVGDLVLDHARLARAHRCKTALCIVREDECIAAAGSIGLHNRADAAIHVVHHIEGCGGASIGGSGDDAQQPPLRERIGMIGEDFLAARTALGQRPALGLGIPGERVVRAGAGGRHVFACGRVVLELGAAAVALLQACARTGGIERADQTDLALESGQPAVCTDVGELPQAVVGAV
ncbi:hypothetical protein NDK37_01155 [Xanthomonas citri pv. glycines]|uniref:hypothetical protein n=1 Tax=Xanthomonas citri TaxID=346 RepID=UPI001E39DEA5|nr:hypothetical protein [Xanthomonas citri]UIX75278.1 hypothetical protein LMJ37_18680 [Xanthomonas citri pv. glycines]WLA20191.1 hypothetical protein NDK37_01155 [Xanthomonas citri pv. glycines]